MKNASMCAIAVALCLGHATAGAADEAAAEGPWSGMVRLGYQATSGNTDNSAANLEAAVNWDGVRWHHSLSGRGTGQSEDNQTTAESYKATYEAKYDFTERSYAFGLLDYNKNRFTTYVQQTFEFVGIGHRFIVTDRQKFSGEAGVGFSQADLATGATQDEFNWRLSGVYELKIGENASFLQTLSVNSGSSNTFTESVTELSANVYGALAMVLSYKVQNNSDVLPGTEKTDTFASVNLEYVF